MDRKNFTKKYQDGLKGSERELIVIEKNEENTEEALVSDDEEEKSIDHELQCSICRATFDDPKTLICQHTFCSSCIERSIPEQPDVIPWLKCPTCQKESLVPSCINTTLRNIIEEKYPEKAKKRKEKQKREEINTSLRERVLKEFRAEFFKNSGRNLNDLESISQSGLQNSRIRGYQTARIPRMFENGWRTPNYNDYSDAREYNNKKTKIIDGNHKSIVLLKRFIFIATIILHIMGVIIGLVVWKDVGAVMGMLIVSFFILSFLIMVAFKEHTSLMIKQDIEYGMGYVN